MKPKPKRLDGGKILVALTARMDSDLSSYCIEKGIESKNELIRQAIAAFIYKDYDDNTLKLAGLKNIEDSLSQMRDMISVLFSYLDFMHVNLLAYHPEIAEEFKSAAYASSQNRIDKFSAAFKKRIAEDRPFFEKLLHDYVTGTLE